MRRLWIGIGILAVLMGAGLGITLGMEAVHTPMAEELRQASQAAQAENWEQAEALTARARARWEKHWLFTAAVADHTPMDEMDSLFSELEVYLQSREAPHFAATALSLCQMAEAMADSHTPYWWNVL